MMAVSAPVFPDLRGMLLPELEQLVERLGEARYRGRQLARWVYAHGAETAEAMTDLPQAFRERLAATVRIGRLAVRLTQDAPDGSATKYLAACEDGQTVECVRMRFDDGRRSACISTQAGCAMGCAFCATGVGGFARNLSAGEILGQFLLIKRYGRTRISNVVFMGMGEPLANYEATVRAVKILAAPYGMGIGMRHITVSTVGLVPQIRRLAAERLQMTLAVSLHAPTDALRDQLVPANRRYPLGTLMAACRAYNAATGRRLTFEYVLIDGVNDGVGEARALVGVISGLRCHINLIPLNPIAGIPFARPPLDRVRAFEAVLRQAGVPVTVRIERGGEIQAACGQLRLMDGSGRASRWTPVPGGPAQTAGPGGAW
jgi:23S rRNA (adenine2503-C2)-methyltransferase